MPATPLASLLVVDDETAQMKALCRTLEPEGYRTTGVTSPREALAALRGQTFDLVLTDLMMPDMDGIALLRKAFEIDPNLVGIVMTGHGTVGTAVEALKAGALDYILKPFNLSAIKPVLARALTVRQLRTENIQLRETVGMYGLSMAIAFALDVDTVLRGVADAAFQQSRGGEISILLTTGQANVLQIAAARGGTHVEQRVGAHVPIDASLAGWVGASRDRLARVDELSDVQAAFAPPAANITGGIAIPMLSGGTLVGVIGFAPGDAHQRITQGQVKALNILASAAASALEASSLLERLRTAEHRYRRLAEDAADIVLRYDVSPRRGCAYVNPAVIPLTGYSPEEHYADPDLALRIVHPDDRPVIEKVLRGETPSGSTVIVRWVHKNGAVRWIEQRNVHVQDRVGRLIAIESIARDVTQRRQLEEQLRHAQKMEAIGRLTAGVAHDFNNLLAVINGYTELMLSGVTFGGISGIRQHLEEVKRAGEQAAALTRQLLAFGRKQLAHPTVLNLNPVVESQVRILRRIIGEDIELVTRLDPSLALVKADQGQIEQVLMNLAVNARDAMPDGGRLTIETQNVTTPAPGRGGTLSGDSGAAVILSVSDTGSGMDATTQARIFEPFFTTKEHGRGTGLGLSVVHGIVTQNEGTITVHAAPGQGASFRIQLPALTHAPPVAATASESGESRGGSETILIVEDDAVVRRLIGTILERAGYDVLRARHGVEALQIQRERGERIRLVLTDLVMPQMSGPAVVESIKRMNPGVKVLYTSGYADDGLVSRGQPDPRVPLLAKPFDAAQLLRKVREVLDGIVADKVARPGLG